MGVTPAQEQALTLYLANYGDFSPEQQQEWVSKKEYYALCYSRALDPAVKPKLLEEALRRVAKRSDNLLAGGLAKNPSLGFEDQQALLDTKVPDVVFGLAWNPYLDPRIQLQLAGMEDWYRVQLASNPFLVEEVVELLLRSSDNVRTMLAMSSHLTPSVRERLAWDESPYVIDTFVVHQTTEKNLLKKKRPARLYHYLDDGFEQVMKKVAAEGGDVEVAAGLLPSWRGSLGDLFEASRMVTR